MRSQLVLAGTVETFDANAFQVALAAYIDIQPSMVAIVNVSSGSLQVTTTATFDTRASATAAAVQLSDTAASSAALGVQVISVASAVTERVACNSFPIELLQLHVENTRFRFALRTPTCAQSLLLERMVTSFANCPFSVDETNTSPEIKNTIGTFEASLDILAINAHTAPVDLSETSSLRLDLDIAGTCTIAHQGDFAILSDNRVYQISHVAVAPPPSPPSPPPPSPPSPPPPSPPPP